MDIRIEHIFREATKGDTSFQEKESGLSLLFGTQKFTKQDMRKTWDEGTKRGIEIGLRYASLEGQIIELNNNTKNEKHREFIEKLYALCAEYKCAVSHHFEYGMVIIDRAYGHGE